jgi:hypothetical protein
MNKMAADKLYKRLEAKIDALLEKSGVDMAQFEEADTNRGQARRLSAAEQDAINNAPKAEATIPADARGPRVTAQNAPDTSSSVPTVPSDAVGTVTVETREPDGNVTVDTVRADDAKRGRK